MDRIDGGARTVLVVDDEPDLCEIVRRMLGGRGYTVLTAHGVTEALSRCTRHDGSIALLVTDLRMPDGNGADLAAKVRDAHPGSAVLYISGLPAQARVAAEFTGADATVLGKPFTPSELLAAVDGILAGR